MSVKIGTKILITFGIMLSLTLGLGWYGMSELDEVMASTTRLTTRDFRLLEGLGEIVRGQARTAALWDEVRVMYLELRMNPRAPDPSFRLEERNRAKAEVEKLLADLDSAVAGFEANAAHTQRMVKWRELKKDLGEIRDAFREASAEAELQFGLMRRGEMGPLAQRAGILERLRRALDVKLAEGGKLLREQMELGESLTAASQSQATFSIGVAMVLALVLSIGAGGALYRSISRPLAAFMEFAAAVGQGDLTQRAKVMSRDELGKLAETLNQMAVGLRDVAAQTRAASENLNAATAEIVASTQQQATSTAEQAAAVQQTTATMEEIVQSGAQISERARQVAAGAEATSAASKAGLQAVQNTTKTMEAIREQAESLADNVVGLSEKTQAVGEIISTVNDIAEQSHLLALNAAIQAAAAGEHGRSFAVVASEMKTLADQCRDATVQVRSILGDIQKGINSSVMLTEEAVKRVESGKQQTDVADGTIRQMADSIQQSVQAFQQIVAGANQQQIGFEQIVQAIKNISQATSQTAVGTQQLEKAATNVSTLSQQMQKAVERYKI